MDTDRQFMAIDLSPVTSVPIDEEDIISDTLLQKKTSIELNACKR